jgi:hypothetical protein
VALAALAGLTVWMLREHDREASTGARDGEPAVLVPRQLLSGLEPISIAIGLLSLPVVLSPWLDLSLFARALPPGSLAQLAVQLALTGAAAFVLARLFFRPRLVAGELVRLLPEGETLDRAALEAHARILGRRAAMRSALYACALGFGARLLERAGTGLFSDGGHAAQLPAALALGVLLPAVLLDLRGEHRFLGEHGPLASVWPLHRLYAVDAALARLRAAGIPAHARHVHARSLWQLFAPWLPVELLVPAAHAPRAAALLAAAAPVAPDASPGRAAATVAVDAASPA